MYKGLRLPICLLFIRHEHIGRMPLLQLMVPEELLSLLIGRLHQERDRIARLWLDAVRRSPHLPSAGHLSDTELTDHLPEVFDDL